MSNYSGSLQLGFGGTDQFQAFIAYANGSALLRSMLDDFGGTITTTPAGRIGTYSNPSTNTIYVDPSWLPTGSNAYTFEQLAHVLAHELGHLLLPENRNLVLASTPDEAIAIGRREEGEAVTAQYIVASHHRQGCGAPD